MSKNVFSTSCNIADEPLLKQGLQQRGFTFQAVNHAFWQAKGQGFSITFYKSGKLLIQGWGADRFADELLKVADRIEGLEHIPGLDSWIGTDEAGKGDFFGPLVVAAVHIERKSLKDLILLEVQDSKSLTDQKISAIASQIKKHNFKYAVLTLEPRRYNELYQQYKNLNKLLAWTHARVITKLLQKVDCSVVLSDKFGDEWLISNELQHAGHGDIQLIQRTQAEDNPAVAAASILARAEFIANLKKLSQKFSIDFPKGASSEVVQAAKLFVAKYSANQLNQVAKTHFKTIHKI